MIFLIVYIGAIAILFLFVIMLLNLRSLNSPELTFTPKNLAISALSAGLSIQAYLFLENAIYVTGYYKLQLFSGTSLTPTSHQVAYLLTYGWNDVLLFTELLYTEHLTLLVLSGMLLLAAMVGSIVLAISTVQEHQRKRNTLLKEPNLLIKTKYVTKRKINWSRISYRLFSRVRRGYRSCFSFVKSVEISWKSHQNGVSAFARKYQF